MTVALITGLNQLNLPLNDITEFGKFKLPKLIIHYKCFYRVKYIAFIYTL